MSHIAAAAAMAFDFTGVKAYTIGPRGLRMKEEEEEEARLL